VTLLRSHSALSVPHSALSSPHSALRVHHSALSSPHSAFRTPRSSFFSVLLLLAVLFSLALATKRCPKCGKTYEDVENYCADCVGSDDKPVKLVPVERAKPQPEKPKPKSEPNPETVLPAQPKPSHVAPAGAVFLSTNARGYEEYLWLKDSSVMVKIPAGEFWMGSPQGEGGNDEHPQHKVSLGEYYIDKCEVTNKQFEKFVRATGYQTEAEKGGDGWVFDSDSSKWVNRKGVSWRDNYGYATENHPVVLVSWNDAKAYDDYRIYSAA